MNVLFVCSMALIRSKTAAECLGFVSDYCGTDDKTERPLSELQIEWADIIVCMESSHKYKVLSLSSKKKDIQVWNILDVYEYLDDSLITIFRGKAEKYLHS